MPIIMGERRDFMKKLYALLVLTALLSGLCVYAEETKGEIADALLRLHVVANSDSYADQALKLKVRDAVRNEFSKFAVEASSKEDALRLAEENIETIKKAAKDAVREEGFDYPVSVFVGKADFPTKTYEKIKLPKGRYDAVNVKIGKAEGRNWWCVMYPPLCIADNISAEFMPEATEELRASVSDSEYELISESDSGAVKIKFKILELF